MNRYIKALLTKHKKKSLPQCLKNTWFDEWMSYGYITFISAFIFQGMLYANWRENVIKIALDIIIGGVFFLFLPWYLAALIAHSMNFCLNGQFLCVFYHIDAGNNTPQKFLACTEDLKNRIENTDAIIAAIAYGSLSKGKWRPSSDIDMRFIPGRGEWAFWRACFWAVKARAIAFFKAFPLDMFVTTMNMAYKQMNKDEMPIIFKDTECVSESFYQHSMSYDEFGELFIHTHIKGKMN